MVLRPCCQGQSDQYTTSCQSLIQGTVEGKGRGPLPRDAGLRRQSCAGLWHRLAVSDCFQSSCSAPQGLQKIPIAMRTTEKVFKGSEIYEIKGHRSKADIFKGK